MLTQPSNRHHWSSPEDLATLLQATHHGDSWRTCCPAHGGENRTALSITLGHDKYGHPCTLLYCHAHQCSAEAICESLGIPLVALFSVQPTYAAQTKNAPRVRSARIDRLRAMHTTSPDDIAQILLQEMIVDDPEFLSACAGARHAFWRLAQEPARKGALMQTLDEARIPARPFWEALCAELGAQA